MFFVCAENRSFGSLFAEVKKLQYLCYIEKVLEVGQTAMTRMAQLRQRRVKLCLSGKVFVKGMYGVTVA